MVREKTLLEYMQENMQIKCGPTAPTDYGELRKFGQESGDRDLETIADTASQIDKDGSILEEFWFEPSSQAGIKEHIERYYSSKGYATLGELVGCLRFRRGNSLILVNVQAEEPTGLITVMKKPFLNS